MDIIYYCNYDGICRLRAIRVWGTENFRRLVFVAQSTFEIAEIRRLTICQWAGCIIYEVYALCRSRWLCGSRCGSEAARLIGLRVRITLGAWMSVSWEYCVLSGRGLCDVPLHSSWRVLPSLRCLTERDLETSIRRRRRPTSDIDPRKRNCSLFQITC